MAAPQATQGPDASRKLEEYIEKIHYSDRYTDDHYEYRHVILPKQLLKMIPKNFFNPDETGTLRLLSEAEWRGIGITQSLGWEHYEVHAPEPHVLLFRRAKDYVPPPQPQSQPQARPKEAVRRK
ncbi:CKS-domain-containing protein [Pluteus cervinus]|uniref:CKS-domain-containing protein n=1 Tax=Pluteus cervinus TaxID=181527 RepID=A0ACD3BEG9_9AGAR|nr:CKS-domain-containing protein [Pluteus cervinus]